MVTTQEPQSAPAETPDSGPAGKGLVPVSAVVGRLVTGVPAQFVGLPEKRRVELVKDFHAGVARRRRQFPRPAAPDNGDHGGDPETAGAEVAVSEVVYAELVDEETDEETAPETRALDVVDPDPWELISAQRAQIRRSALAAAIPDGRAEAALRGLSCLDPNDQHPADLRVWLDDPDKLTLVLAGPTGNGKTMAAYATAAEAALRGAAMRTRTGRAVHRELVVRAWTVNGYLAELRPDGSPEPQWAIRNRARWAELLILDDLGAEVDAEAREFVRKELVELLEYRIENRRRTVFTTNLRAAEIEQAFHSRFWSRLNDRATGLLFTGPDRRTLNMLDW